LHLTERGDYSLAGTGTLATQVLAGAIVSVKVTEIDGVTLATPITLSPSNASVGFNLAANPGVTQPWSLGTTLLIKSQLTSMNIPFTFGATKVDVVLDDSLLAISQPSTIAFIAKKDFVVSVDTDGKLVPEPGSFVLASLGLGAFGLIAYRRRHGVKEMA